MVENLFSSDRCFTRRFPGDPRFASWIIPTSDDVRSLPRKVFLSTHLLDCILQRAAPPPEPESPNFSHIGSLYTLYYMNNANDLPKTEMRILVCIVRAMSSVFQHNPQSVKRLIIPIVEASVSLCCAWTCEILRFFATPHTTTNAVYHGCRHCERSEYILSIFCATKQEIRKLADV
jgi:hypothetical protein